MNVKRFIPALVLSIALLFATGFGGCKDPYGASAKVGADIGTGIAEGMKTVAAMTSISVQDRSRALDILEFVNLGDKGFIACVDSAHSTGGSGTFTSCANGFNTYLNNPAALSLVGISDTNASQQVSGVIKTVTAAVGSLIAALGGK
jgi:hypothetical protein